MNSNIGCRFFTFKESIKFHKLIEVKCWLIVVVVFVFIVLALAVQCRFAPKEFIQAHAQSTIPSSECSQTSVDCCCCHHLRRPC